MTKESRTKDVREQVLKQCGFVNTDKINVYFTDVFDIEEGNKGETAEEINRYVTYAATTTPHSCEDTVAVVSLNWKEKNKQAKVLYQETKKQLNAYD